MIRVILIFFFIVAVIAIFYSGWQFLKNLHIELGPAGTFSETQGNAAKKETQEVKSVTKPSQLGLVIRAEKPGTTLSVDTSIISGPEEGKIIEETNEVTFGFEATVWPEKPANEVFFETRIEGLETSWLATYSNERTLRLPSGPREYKFLVRARIGDAFDLTPASRTFRINISPFFGKVRISNVSIESSYYPSRITLSSQASGGEKINITNWQVKARNGIITIPQAYEIYPPLYDPSAKKDILLGQSGTVYLKSGPNPLGTNQNFRLNKCLGYLDKSLTYFFGYCPQPNKLEQISNLDEYCQEFILHIQSCEVPDYSKDSKVSVDLECRDYIDENFNYPGCLRNYSQDKDFLQSSWYVYPGYDILSKLHDTIYLHDQNGLLVDKYLY